MITCVVVDDERRSRSLLDTMIRTYCKDVRLLGMAETREEGIRLIREKRPQVVLLDVELAAGSTGFHLLDETDVSAFEVIFTTGYQEYALRAIKYNCVDYLLKPIDLYELKQALDKARNRIATQSQLTADQRELASEKQQLAVPTDRGYKVLNLDQVVVLKAEGSYIEIQLEGDTCYLTSSPLGVYEKQLDTNGFLRIHRSYLVNLAFISEYIRGRGGYVKLKNGSHLDVSARKKSALLEALGLKAPTDS